MLKFTVALYKCLCCVTLLCVVLGFGKCGKLHFSGGPSVALRPDAPVGWGGSASPCEEDA